MEAGVTVANGQPAYEVQVAKADAVQRVTVSGADGRVLLVAQAQGEHGGDERDNDAD